MSTLPCGCCEGVETLTPAAVANRPGLPAIRYRVGTHATFLETMKARLSGLVMDIAASEGGSTSGRVRPLDALRTREATDPSIALLDAWASVADVLTFYHERIANEGYLETATERLSVLELARLIGYRLRPGVAASVHLAFRLDPGYRTTIPAGTRAQNVPEPGETMESFETAEPFEARTEWNDLTPRLGRPQVLDRAGASTVKHVYLAGTATKLEEGDALLLVVGRTAADRVLRFVASVELQTEFDRTKVTLHARGAALELARMVIRTVRLARETAPERATAQRGLALLEELEERVASTPSPAELLERIEEARRALVPVRDEALARGFTRIAPWATEVVERLEEHAVSAQRAAAAAREASTAAAVSTKPAAGLPDFLSTLSAEPPPPARAVVDTAEAFSARGDALPRALTIFRPALGRVLYPFWKRLPPSTPNELEVYALRVVASPFGFNAQKLVDFTDDDTPEVKKQSDWPDWTPTEDESETTLYLDAAYKQVRDGGYVAVVGARGLGEEDVIAVTDADVVARSDYGISSRSTRLLLEDPWWDKSGETDLRVFRRTVVYAGSELLETADEPIEDDVEGSEIELGDLYEGLEAGRPVIVEGERTVGELGSSGVRVAELAVLAGARQAAAKLDPTDERSPDRPGERVHTTLRLTQPLTFRYKRDTVVVHGNIGRATHGESRSELLGSGDAKKAHQSFQLRQSPLTYVSAPTVSGAESTLAVRVDEVLWHEAESFLGLVPAAPRYVTATDDAQKTTVTFGDGVRGPRLPSGSNNVAALYRVGIGKPGNVKSGSITLLAAKPLGVKDVVNPLPATGGADPESRDQARRNAPTAVMALDRLVSVSDYEDFARVFAGVGKASAVRLPLGRRNVVHVTIAGVDDIPIATTSDLYRNLLASLRRFGDPHQAVRLAVRELVVVLVAAGVRLDPNYLWSAVEPKIRAALEEAFGFERQELAQPIAASWVVATIQAVPGVVYVDLDAIRGLTEQQAIELLTPRPEPVPGDSDQPPALGSKIRGETAAARHRSFVSALPARLEEGAILPAQLAYVRPDLANTVVLREITR
jgi:predicted phage baseplate assembly protein